jgi:hypothetical protein
MRRTRRGARTKRRSLTAAWLKVGGKGLSEGFDGRFGGFEGGGEAKLAEGRRGDGTDRSEDNASGEGDAGGFEQ